MFIDLKTTPKYIGRSNIVSSYLEEIRKYRILTIEEEKEIFERIKNGDVEARNEIIQSNQRFVFAVAKRYATNEINLLDIINEANIGLIKAIDTFNEALGYKFTTYAVWYITREINAYLTNNENIIHKSNNIKTNKKLQKIKNEYFLKNGCNPSIIEIMDIFKEKYNCDIIDERDLYELTIDSIDSNISDDDSFTVDETYNYNAKSSVKNIYEQTENNDYNKILVKELLNNLSDRDETVIKLLYGIDYDRSYEINEISHILDLSSERIRQIKNTVITQLRKKMQCQNQQIAI